MSKLTKSLAILIAGGGLAVSLAGAALATPGVARTIDPSTLTPQQRAEFFRAPLGDHDPFGNPVETGCMWSRMQIPTGQGLHWVAEEECNGGDRGG